MTPEISVVLPTFNRRRTLERTLACLTSQDLAPEKYEVIVVSDGCTDDTASYVRNQQSRCVLRLVEQQNAGPGAARNSGVREARGEIVLILDDDLSFETSLVRTHLEAHAGRRNEIVFGPVLPQRPSRFVLADRWLGDWAEAFFSGLPIGEQPDDFDYVVPNSSAPRALWLEHPYDERCPQDDLELGLRLSAARVPFVFVPGASVLHAFDKPAEKLVAESARCGHFEPYVAEKIPSRRHHLVIARAGALKGIKRVLFTAAVRSRVNPNLLLTGLRVISEKLHRASAFKKAAVKILDAQVNLARVRGAASAVGGWRALEPRVGARLAVLMYHHVGPARAGANPELTISPQRFECQMRWLKRHGYTAISARQWGAWLDDGCHLPEKPVLITFDDAYAELSEHAFPILEHLQFPALVFAVADEVGASSAWDVKFGWTPHRTLNAAQMRVWSERGIEFGSHSSTHADLRSITCVSDLEREVTGSAEKLSDILGRSIDLFSYPHGGVNERARECVARRYALAFSSCNGLNTIRTDRHLLRRSCVLPTDSMLDFACRVWFGKNWRERLGVRLRELYRRYIPAKASLVAVPKTSESREL